MKLAPSSNLLKIAFPLLALGCSAEASSPAPKDYEPGNNNGGKGGSLNTSGSGNVLPTGGNPNQGTGGTGNQGTAGTSTGTAGTSTGTAGTSTGTGGGGALAACPSPPAAGAIADVLIDDLEDKDNGVAKVGNRTGFWYTYLDAYGSMITPAPDATGVAPLKPGATDCHGGMACVLVSGTTALADEVAMKYPYAGVGFDFSNAKKPCVYNGTAYTGIKLWARGDVPIRVKINTSGTADAGGGGTCATNCNDGYGMDFVLTPTWAELDMPFASLAQEGWGTVVTFDKAALLSVQIQIPAGQTFSAAFDDITFY
jgi:hypothetical protein